MNIGIYDLAVNQKYYMQASSGSMFSNPVFDMPIHPLLVMPRDEDSNRAPYIVSKDDLILDDMIVSRQYNVANGSVVGYGFDFSRVHSIDKMLHGLILPIQEKALPDVPDCRCFRLHKEGKVEYQRYGDYLRHWFYAQNELVSQKVDSDRNLSDASYTIIPISERFDVDAQEYLIRANSTSGSRTALIWRSVAACMGIEEKLKAKGLHEGSIVYVFDFNNLSNTVSKITMHELDGRLIPGHHLFKRTGQDTYDKTNYPIDKYSIINDNLNYDFPFDTDSNGLVPAQPVKRVAYTGTIDLEEQPEFIILIGDVRDSQIDYPEYELTEDRIYRDFYGDSVIVGAGRFANRMDHHIVSYYDECEELSMAIITADEEVKLETLIKASDKLTGGLAVKGEAIEGIGLNTANPVVDFYLLLGDPGRDVPLKVLRQELHASTKLQNNAKKLPLVLHPSLVAGQGRAKVLVDTLNVEDSEFFQSVYLDWENMKDAIDEKTKTPITVEFLEETMERSFPTSLPAVCMNLSKFRAKFRKFEMYIQYPMGPFPAVDINYPSMPNKGIKKGVDQFVRENVFGNPRSNRDLPISPRERDICIRFFKVLNDQYLSNLDDSRYITPISWTYHGEYFPEFMDSIRCKMKGIARGSFGGLAIQELSACANMLESDTDLILFMEAFFKIVHKSDGIMHWLRVGYQILMYNTTFLRYIDIGKLYACIDDVLAYLPRSRSNVVSNTVISFFIFLLKVRRYHPDFCKITSPELRDRKYYTKLMYLTMPLEEGTFKSIIRAKQCIFLKSIEDNAYREIVYKSDLRQKSNCYTAIYDTPISYFPRFDGGKIYEYDKTDYESYGEYLLHRLDISDVYLHNEDATVVIFESIVRAKQAMVYSFSEDMYFHDLGYWYSSFSRDKYFKEVSCIPVDLFPNSIKAYEPYSYDKNDYGKYHDRLFKILSISSFSFGEPSPWRSVLEAYLNGKGNLNLPIG